MENKNDRRDFLRKTALLTLAGAGLRLTGSNMLAGNLLSDETLFTLPDLPYPHEALEPYIDSLTMQIHHDKHHKSYVDNLNKAIKENKLEVKSLESLLAEISNHPPVIRNNAGGHYNHSFFWKILTPKGGGNPTGEVNEAINGSFGSFTEFQDKFNAAAMGRFGSGWAWLYLIGNKLAIGTTPNQDNPIMNNAEIKGKPILALDVWEHAYYLKYQNKRAEYVNAFWSLVNWNQVNQLMKSGK